MGPGIVLIGQRPEEWVLGGDVAGGGEATAITEL